MCDHPDCTGSHNDRKPDLCPRSRENKRQATNRTYWKHHDKKLGEMARYRTTSAFMLSQSRYDATRRGGKRYAATQSD